MPKKNNFFHTGKLKHEFLGKMVKDFISDLEIKDKRVIQGSKIGEDAAVLDMGTNNYLVVKTDPITFATYEIGYYAINVNVNDVACMGATPKWFQSTILLPEKKTSQELVENIFKSLHDTCESIGITIIGGHTEVTPGIERPIVVGFLLGEVEKDKLIRTSGAEIGDALILTKGVFIEGTSIIGREKEAELERFGLDSDFIKKCKNYLYDPGISVLKEAQLASENFKIKAMHDVTEGGLNCAIAEVAISSKNGILIENEKIKVLPEPLLLSKLYKLNPLNTISSGSLLIVTEQKDSSDLIELLRKNNINAVKIGEILSEKKGLLIKDDKGKISALSYSETDEITKVF
ncbi:MAG TPA: AIR synthase family protein [Candidatus Lokiarchaeia archaeon]